MIIYVYRRKANKSSWSQSAMRAIRYDHGISLHNTAWRV